MERLKPIGLSLVMVMLLTACASPSRLQPGASREDVRSVMGTPFAVYPLGTGQGTRLEYVLGPFQQTVYMVDLDPDGRLTQWRQVRQFENFFRLRPGEDDTLSVRREFGVPWRVEHYALSDLTAWLYPYRESGSFNSMMAVQFDASGRVHSVVNGPDPRFLGGSERD